MNDKQVSIEMLYKKLSGALSADEELQFEKWSQEPEHRQYFEHLKEYDRLEEQPSCSDTELQESWLEISKKIQRKRWQENWRRIYRKLTVAAILSMIGFSGYFYGLWEEDKETGETVSICPGQGKVVLQLSDGSTYDLKNPAVLNRSAIGQHIRMDSNRLNYLQSHAGGADSLVYHKLIVPRGGEFQLMLEDGTKVWLNAETSLRYPQDFTGGTREVYLEGEAYFEVARDTLHPFVVHTGIQRLTVLGTGFSITAYRDDDYLQTTLVEGKVKVELSGRIYHLNPNEQITYNRNNKQVSLTPVDVQEFTAWKDGKYVFSRKRLEDMLITLSRWYDFEVFYQNPEAKEVLFSGELLRFANFNDILGMIEKSSDVHFAVKQNVVMVTK